MLRLIRIATAKRDCPAVRKTSATWRPSISMGDNDVPEMLKAIGRDPTSSVHWLTFEEIRIVIPAAARPRRASIAARMNSGASEASGATHCTSRNSSIPSDRPESTSPSAKGSAAAMTVPAANVKRPMITPQRSFSGSAAMARGGPNSSPSRGGDREESTR